MGAFPHIRYAARSDVGRKRTNNEDAFGAFPASGIFCVADGMGGGDDGEVASAATVRAVERFTQECPISEKFTYPIEGIVSGIRNAVNSASAWIANRTRQKGIQSCGSTFVGICFDAARPSTAIALHAGDSRLYRIRGRSIERMTVDHSAAELIGAKNDEDVNPMFRGMILRAVGIQPSAELERTEVKLKVRDRILICTDGLSRMVNDKKLLSIIRAGNDLETTADRLVAAANDAGGVDNITVVLIEVGEFPAPLSTSPLMRADGGDTVSEEVRLADAVNTHATKSESVAEDPSTEDDFIPSTAKDVEGESVEEELNIPESDTEDDLADSTLTPRTGVFVQSKASTARKNILVCRLLTNRFILAGLLFALALAVTVVMCICSRAADEADKKMYVETKMHTKEQKGSLQTIAEKRKAEQEQKARAEEEEKTRLEILTLAKQKELDENARKAAERRMREEAEAREKAEAEARREKEAKAQEAARQEEARKAEELRKQRELEKAKAEMARAEAERKEKERLAREEAAHLEQLRKVEEERRLKKAEEARARARKESEERARREKQNQVIGAFADVVADGAAARFYAKIKDRIPNSIPADLHQKLAQAGNSKHSRTELIAAIVALTKDIQQVAQGLMEYSSLELENIECDLADAANENQAKNSLMRGWEGITAFEREAGDFIKQDAADPAVQIKCVRIIRLVPEWFDF